MSKIWITLKLRDGREMSSGGDLTAEDVEYLETHPMTPRTAVAIAAFYVHWNALSYGLKMSELPAHAEEWSMEWFDDEGSRVWLATQRYRPSGRSSVYAQDQERSPRVARCCSILEKAGRLLPRRARSEVMDEWIDEIVTAEHHGRSIHRRTGSLLCRALPLTIWSSLWSKETEQRARHD